MKTNSTIKVAEKFVEILRQQMRVVTQEWKAYNIRIYLKKKNCKT